MSTSPTARIRDSQSNVPYPRRRRASLGQRIFRTVLLILVVALITIAGTLYFVWPDISQNLGFTNTAPNTVEASAEMVEPAVSKSNPSAKPIFVAFEPFTVALSKDGRSRILYVGITLQVSDKDSQSLLMEYQPVVRDRILTTLSNQDPAHVQSTEGRQALTTQLEDSLKAPYHPSNQVPDIEQVLFTAFVVQ